MMMTGRKYSADGSYRYGFNGKENDNDISSLTAYDYGFRIYNPALGRFLSVDPLFKSYPWYTPYQFAGNKPIWAIDLDGLEEDRSWQTMQAIDESQEALSPKTWWDNAVDGIGNGILRLGEWLVTDKVEGRKIREVLRRNWVDVSEQEIDDATLGANFQIVKKDRTFQVQPDGGVLNDLLQVLVGTIDVVSILPPAKNNPAHYVMKISPIVGKTISEVVTALKIKKRTEFFKTCTDAASGKPIKEYEAELAAIVEESQGGWANRLRRAEKGEAGDFIIGSGTQQRSIDMVGIPKDKMTHFDMSNFKNSIRDHFRKSINVIVLDIRSLTKEQGNEVMKYIKENFSSSEIKLFIINNP